MNIQPRGFAITAVKGGDGDVLGREQELFRSVSIADGRRTSEAALSIMSSFVMSAI